MKVMPTKGWLFLDKNYEKVLAHAISLSKLMKRIEKIKKEGVIAKANKRTHAYIG